jgi:CDP-6-deoxy-D-xylo-4-hexulose-3-dehydrase
MEIQAAIGISQISDIATFLKRRRAIAKYVNDKLENTKFKLIGSDTLANIDESESNSWMLLPIQAFSEIEGPGDKRKLLSHFEANGIETRPVLTGNFLDQPAMKRIYSPSPNPRDFPVSDLITNTTFLIGAHHDISDSQVEYIGEKIIEIANE